jgi:two-component system chemotaxis sensor kinase CheA
MDDLLREFLAETGEHLDVVDVELVRFEREPNNEAILRNIFRLVHTIKGTCGFLGLPRLEALAHAAETLMGRFRDGMAVTSDAVTLILATLDRIKHILLELEHNAAEPDGTDDDLISRFDRLAAAEPTAPAPAEVEPAPDEAGSAADESGVPALSKVQTIRVSVDTLEHLMIMVSELVLTRNQLLEIARRQDESGYKVPLQRLSQVTAALQDGVMKTRMQPIGTAWQKLPRVIRDLAAELGKTIELVMHGAEAELDRQVLELIKDPLMHMIRNAADHGIETPLERRAAGKPEKATIRLRAYHQDGTIALEIADDGRGLDLPAIRRRARERGLATEAELARLSDAQVAKFIFHPGFSTAKAVTALSGRGVGMDVVKANIELIGGTIDIASEAGRGTTFTLKIPLTLAIVAALIVIVDGRRFAIPQAAVLELVRVEPGTDRGVEHISGASVLRHRGRLLPIIPVSAMLGVSGAEARPGEEGFVVVSQVGRRQFGMLVHGVLHTEEIVVKPMCSKLRHIPLFSGNTILGDGAVVLILDPNGIARAVGGEGDREQFMRAEPAECGLAEDAERVTLLVFRAGGRSLKAVPLSLVARLEEIEAAQIEWAGGRPLIQYRGRLMPLVPVGPAAAIKAEGPQAVVVFSEGERAMGLLVDEIVDIVEEKALEIERVADRADLVGSAVVRGRATEIVDVAHYLPLAHEDWARPAARRGSAARTILLVDDSAFFREMLAPVLKAAGYRVATAESADQALALVSSGARIDTVVADLDMPGRDGLDLTAALRAHPRSAGLPVIALSSAVTPAALDRARRLGIAEFVGKFDRSGLLATLAEIRIPVGEAA